MCNSLNAGHIERDVVAGGRHAKSKSRASTNRNHGEFLFDSNAYNFCGLFGVFRLNRGRGRNPVDEVIRKRLRLGSNISIANNIFEARRER